MILSLLGVSRDDIFEDYLMTNVMRKEANDQILDKVRADGYSENILRAVQTGMSENAEYLQSAFSVVEDNFGSMLEYLVKGIGISEAVVDEMKLLYIN